MLILSNDTQQREQHAVAADLEREGGGAAGGREGGSSGSERVCVWRERGSEGARERGGERASEGASERESERERAREGGKRAPPSPPSRVCVEGGKKEGSEGGGGASPSLRRSFLSHTSHAAVGHVVGRALEGHEPARHQHVQVPVDRVVVLPVQHTI